MGVLGARLTAVKVRALVERGRCGDGGGLYLQVQAPQQRSWLFRYKLHGRARAMGLGAVADMSLAEAREAALECRRLIRQGIDPIDHRRSGRADSAALAGRLFRDVV